MRKNNLFLIYIAVIVITAAYLIYFEGVGTKHTINIGGEDNYFSPFDVFTIAISIIALALLIIAFIAYRRHPDEKMLMIGLAFLLFTIMGILDLIDNFFPGSYSAIGIIQKIINFLILLTFLAILFRKN